MTKTERTIIDILKKYSFEKKKLNSFHPELKIIKDLKINSARIVDIVLDVEEAFDIEIDDDSLEKIITINDLKTIVENKTNR
ncbi:MAG: phosphopantetheine-binding protein [Bacteroidota bacterium]|nr:phosphopantetheine-binding protein [Bacteroidota bacterium]